VGGTRNFWDVEPWHRNLERKNPWGVSSWSRVNDFRACRHHHRHWVQQVTWIPWRECRRPVNSEILSHSNCCFSAFLDLGRWFCASLTFDPPTDPFIVSSPCERRRWSKRMLSLENDTHRCRCRRFLLCHDCRFFQGISGYEIPAGLGTDQWEVATDRTAGPGIQKFWSWWKFVGPFWTKIVMENRRHLIKGQVHVGFCMYCIYVCMYV